MINFMKINNIKYILLLFICVSNLVGDIVTDQLINKTHKINWYMFQVITGATTRRYLASNRDSGEIDGIKIWNFTNKRKWRPISNAQTFDGFVGAARNFKSISISDDGKNITFGAKSISKNIPLDTYLDDLANKTFEIHYYYWMTENGFPFLAFNRDSVAGISVYQHTSGGKWRAIHNAAAFDGYQKASSIFSEVSISDDGREISIEYDKFNIPTIKNVLPRETIVEGFRISSNSLSDDDYKNNVAYDFISNPHIDWANAPANALSIAAEIVNLHDKKAVWRVVNINIGDNNTSFIPAGADKTYNGMLTLENDYDFKKEFYTGGNHLGHMPSGDYLLTLYALSVSSVTNMTDAKKHAIEYVNLVFKAP